MKLRELIDEKYGLPGNVGRDFGERFMRDLIGSGKFAELWTAFEATYPEMQPSLAKTFEKTNDLLGYIKPELGDETYRVSSLSEPVAQELDEYLDNILAAIDELSNLDEVPNQKIVSDAIQYFDGLFRAMLDIFTSNTAADKPLEPYKQSNIGFGIKEVEYGVYDLLRQHMDQIKLDSGPHTYRMLQTQLAKGDDAWVESWLAKNGYIEDKPSPFEEQTKIGFNEDTEDEIDKLAKANPDVDDPLNLGGKLGMGNPKHQTMTGYGNFDTLDRIAKARKDTLSLPSRIAKIKDTKVKAIINQLVVPFNKAFEKIKSTDEKTYNDISAGVEVVIDFILKSNPKKSDFNPNLKKAKSKVLEFIERIKLKGSIARSKQIQSNLKTSFEKLTKDLLDAKNSGKFRLEEEIMKKSQLKNIIRESIKELMLNEHYYVDSKSDDEEYCPVCAAERNEGKKKGLDGKACWDGYKLSGTKMKGGKRVDNCVKNEVSKWDGMASKQPGMWDGKPSEKGQPFPAVGEAKTKPAKGKRFAKKVKNPKTGRTRTVSYGQAGKAKKGGDRIRPGTAKGNAYCARSAKIKKCKNPPCANALSRKKWKCQGSRSVK